MTGVNIKNMIEKHEALLIYFFSPGCVTCNSLRPKVEEMTTTRFPNLKLLSVDASKSPLATSEAGVYSAPTIIVYFDGKEYIRESKYISVDQLEKKISRIYDMVFG